MNKNCVICTKEGKYKCPSCLVFYCSAPCCKTHRENKCTIVKNPDNVLNNNSVNDRQNFTTTDTISDEKLQELRDNKTINNLLSNPHLRNLLETVDKASDPEEIMQKAMQEPIFVELADACLAVVEPKEKEDT